MKKLFLLCFLFLLLACGKKAEFVAQLQGNWKVIEVQYIYPDTTYTVNPPNMQFKFQNYSYQTHQNDTLIETGNFNVNPNTTQITFQNGTNNKVYLIEENTNENQTWMSKNKLLEFYIKFRLEKQ